MLKSAIDKILSLATPNVVEIAGETYCDKDLTHIDFNPKATPIKLSTLSSLVDYIRSGVDHFTQPMIIHVESPTVVSMYSALDRVRHREYLVRVTADVPGFEFDRFINHETFCIGVQSRFVDDPETDKALLLKFAGTVESGSVADYGDDGITQKATVKTGIASKSDAIIPSPLKLAPYRTFIDIAQPTSSFIFRMKEQKYDGITCGLFEADGGAWKMEAMRSIQRYLLDSLEDFGSAFTVIS